MMTLRCTRKLLERVGVSAKAETAPPTTVLGDWYAKVVCASPQQLVLCMNERTLLVVVLPPRDFKNVAPRFRAQVVSLLTRIGVPAPAIAAEEKAMLVFGFGPTANRRVLGCLNAAAFVVSYELENPQFSSIAELEDHFSDYNYSPTGYRRPRELAQEFFAASGPASGPSVHRIH
jgi:hypothetical protein